MIAPGSLYESEELGWFRITFTVGKALKEGLARILKALEDFRARQLRFELSVPDGGRTIKAESSACLEYQGVAKCRELYQELIMIHEIVKTTVRACYSY
jgi:hypothetical protein